MLCCSHTTHDLQLESDLAPKKYETSSAFLAY